MAVISGGETGFRFRGRVITPLDIALFNEIIQTYNSEGRTKISQVICEKMNWKQANGKHQEGMCRTLLNRLARKELIKLPAPKRATPPNPLPVRIAPPEIELDQAPLSCPFADVAGVTGLVRARNGKYRKMYKSIVHQYGGGYRHLIGEHLNYLILIDDRPAGCVGVSSAPRYIECRNNYLNWDRLEMQKNIQKVVKIDPFFILPWFQVDDLAAAILSMLLKSLPEEWIDIYNHDLGMIEAYIDPRTTWNPYRDEGWKKIGQTKGKSAQGEVNRPQLDVYAYEYPDIFRKKRGHMARVTT